ncbi:MAG TPA: hypothetical protein VM821_00895 [Abditibacteriaceae bacterium]|jgi:hypothetical protein|nr:hypothetical protein [Abditibacteriaceae bacterium]
MISGDFMSDEKRPQNTGETSVEDDEQNLSGTGFEMAPDDPRSVNRRGGLEAVMERSAEPMSHEPTAKDMGPADMGTTGGDFDPKYVGAGATGANTTDVDSGIVNLNTTGSFGSSSEPPGVGPSESIIGTRAPQLEMTDVGLVDLASTDMSVTGDDENQQGGGARVDGADGQPL